MAIFALCCAVELALAAADAGLIGSSRWRALAYQYGAFWPGLLFDWRANYAAQPYAMFLSYAVLHGGFGHLVGNMVTLVVLGGTMRRHVGQGRFLAIYVGAALGGAGGFALMSATPQPMVGASGALFGLAGALICWDLSERRADGRPLWPMAVTVLGLVALNLGMWLVLDGILAWQTHLGGFLTGWVLAGFFHRR